MRRDQTTTFAILVFLSSALWRVLALRANLAPIAKTNIASLHLQMLSLALCPCLLQSLLWYLVFLGMKIATYTNARTTLEARKGLGKPFITGFRSGAVMALLLAANRLLALYIAINLFKL